MIRIAKLVCALSVLIPAQGTTLRKASLDDLIYTATSIVRARVTGSSVATKGPLSYTHYSILVLDRWKGPAEDRVDVQVPVADGAPQFSAGAEYVFFLWTGPSGANHVLGLSQGALDVRTDTAGNTTVMRQPNEDGVQMKLSEFAGRVAGTLKGRSTAK
jgi:hypothetical protein